MNDWKRLSLNGTWQIHYISADEIGEEKKYPKTITELEGYGEGCLDGDVPGNFELSLEKAGIVPEIFKEQNVLLLQKYEGYHVFYSRTFEYEEQKGFQAELYFEGLDTICEVWVNGVLAGKTENMAIPHTIKPANLKSGTNEIVVHFLPVCMEARKYEIKAGHYALRYNYASLHVRKAPHMFGWDIAPRIVSCGIYRPVSLIYRPKEYIKQTYLSTAKIDKKENSAELIFFFETNIESADLRPYTIEVKGVCEDSEFSTASRLWSVGGNLRFAVENAKFWEPKGKGVPYLYDITVTLKKGEQIVDTARFRSGIRIIELIRTRFTNEQLSGEFYFKVNGEKIFILGTNFVPIDVFHSRDRERLPRVCELLEDVGCNAIRLWGGNIYEDDYLYDYCDEHGILIWQDFMMACGIYPQDEEMCKMIANEIKVIVRRLRNHPSIAMWAGDNENDAFTCGQKRDPNHNKLTRQVITDVLREEDPFRIYLPSSPYIDEPARPKMHPLDFNYNIIEDYTEQHLWGARNYFRGEYYGKNLANFASEIGYHGCTSPNSIRRFISEENIWPWQNNPNWLVHAASAENTENGCYHYRIKLMSDQIENLFGEAPEDLENFALASQISQAEAKKFFVELFRLDKERRSGIIWWNLIDGWPQFSDAVVDYYFEKKLAYYYIKNIQNPVLLSCQEPEDGVLPLKAVNDTGETIHLTYKVTDYETGTLVATGEAVVGERPELLKQIPYSDEEKHLYIIEWDCEAGKGLNHYLCGQPVFDFRLYRSFLKDFGQCYGYGGMTG